MDLHLFSEENENAALLAADIVKHQLGRIAYYNDLNQAGDQYAGQAVYLYFIKTDEEANLKDVIRFRDVYKKMEVKHVFVFSSVKESELILDSLNLENCTVELINPAERAVLNLLYEHPLFRAADNCDAEEMSVLLAGDGPHVETFLKAVLWCGRMKSRRLKVHVIGSEAKKLESKLKLYDLGLFDQDVKDNSKMKDFGLIPSVIYSPLKLTRMKFYDGATDSQDFEEKLEECLLTNYIIVDEGDDLKTLRTALYLRNHFVRKYIMHPNYLEEGSVPVTRMPEIYAYMKDDLFTSLMPELRIGGEEGRCGDSLNLQAFGSKKSVFSVESVIQWQIADLAKSLYYDKFSETLSIKEKKALYAGALHMIYKLRDLNIIEKPEGPLDEEKYEKTSAAAIKDAQQELKYELAALEHQRWCIYMLTEGWIPAHSYRALRYCEPNERGVRDHRLLSGKIDASIIENSNLSSVGAKLHCDATAYTKYHRETVVRLYEKFVAVRKDFEPVHIIQEEAAEF